MGEIEKIVNFSILKKKSLMMSENVKNSLDMEMVI